ncbi:MAG: hypothetical protein HY064_04130 [Bacteroidetes bacterium]|nr:hypothetical protein [Bacteroidota bacterium]
MKIFSFFRPLPFFIAAVFFMIAAGQSCKMAGTQIQILQPADIMLPQHFQKFVLADRTRPGKGNGQGALNVLEGIATGEGVFTDKWGAEDCIEGLRQVLIQTPRYTVTVAAVDTALKGTGRRQTMPPLDWNTVKKMVGGDTSTGLIVLEAFDSNTDIFSEIASAATATSPASYRAHGRVNVYCVWRIYDLKNRTVVDEYNQDFNTQFDGSGATAVLAEGNLPARNTMVQRAGIAAGQQYAHRISPQWIWVARSYYKKGSPEMRRAAHLARVKNWHDATDIWNKQSTSSDPKIASRASYNLALSAEQDGQLDLAIQWAERAQTMGDKCAGRYIAILNQRKADIDKLNEQMKGKKQ